MKSLYILFCIIFIAVKSFSSAPVWSWAYENNRCTIDLVKTDPAGNIFLAGGTASGATFGGYTFSRIGMLIAKCNTAGNILWAKVEPGYINASSITTDLAGNLYVAGGFRGDSATGVFVIENDTLLNVYSYYHSNNMIVIKYDPNGNFIWAKSAQSMFPSGASSITIDPLGNLYVMGGFGSGTSSNNTIVFDTIMLTSHGYYDFFIAKYDSGGSIMWAKNYGGQYDEYGTSVKTDLSGNLFLSGYYNSPTWTFDTIPLINAGTGGTFDVLVAKLDSNGNVLWAKSVGGSNYDQANALSMDDMGNVYVGGNFHSTQLSFGSQTLINSGPLCDDFFLAKYDESGNAVWAISAGGSTCDDLYDLSTDSVGNTYIAGYYSSDSVTIGSDTLHTTPGHELIYMAEYNNNGNPVWTKTVGDSAFTLPRSIDIDRSGNVFFAGSFQNFGILLDTIFLPNNPFYGIFYGKLGALPVGINEQENSEHISLFPNPISESAILQFDKIQFNAKISTLDISGRIIRSEIFSGSQFEIDRKNLKPGIYLIKVETEKQNYVVLKMIVA